MAFSLKADTNWCHDFPKLARESGFRFNRHGAKVRVDWKRISSIDIDKVISERDLSTIDDNVYNIADFCLESEYDIKILDSNFVKLFRLAQLAIEYLLYCKRYLDHSVVILKDELRSKIEENAKLNKRAKLSEDTVKELKDRLMERSRGVERQLSDSHGEIHKCPHCPKTFISSVFMSAHVNRRHPSSSGNLSQLNSTSPVPNERYRAEAEKLHDEIKTLKERLNLTERLIRKESDNLLLSSHSIVTSTNDKSAKCGEKSRDPRDEDRSNEELQHRLTMRYEEEMKHFKETLLSEIRQQNLKLVDRFSSGIGDTTDFYSGENAKELIKQQEKEIQQLRDQLNKRLTPDIEDIQVKVNNQEDLWQSKMENLERRYRTDIERLYTELKITRESADRMRVDYITKINDLERESQDRRRNMPIRKKHGNPKIPRNSEDCDNSANKNIPFPIESHSANHLISCKRDYVKEGQRVDSYLTIRDERGDTTGKFIVNDNNALVGVSSNEIINYSYHCHKDSRNERSRSGRRLEGQMSTISLCNDDSDEALTNDFDNNHLSNSFKAIDNPRQDAVPVFGSSTVGADTAERHIIKGSFETIKNVDQQAAHPSVANVPKPSDKSIIDKLISSDSVTESEASSAISSSSDSSSSKSWSESESPDVAETVVNSELKNTEESRVSRFEVKSNNRNEEFNRERIINDIYTRQRGSDKSGNKETVEQLNSKLRDLGIDPEWQGIPKATLKQLMETVRHHRSLNCKKYRKLDEIRRELFEQITRKVSAEGKIVSSLDEGSPVTRLEKFLTNVKVGREWKVSSRLDNNEGSYSVESLSNNKKGIRGQSELMKKPTQRDLANNFNDNVENVHIKSKSPRKQRNCERSEDDQISKRVTSRVVKNNSTVLRIEPQSTVNPSDVCTSDLKCLSHSYESLKSFHCSEGAYKPKQEMVAVWEGKINVPGTLVTSTPQKNEEEKKVNAVTRQERDSSLTFTNDDALTIKMQEETEDRMEIEEKTKEDDGEDFCPVSPRKRVINKSVIKSATHGSVTSLVKKKVVFDLESTPSESPDSLADKYNFEISRDEINEKEAYRAEKQSGNIVFKTVQSDKIARISKQIEQQLTVARRKPVGSVEAMFADKLAVTEDNKTAAVLDTPKLHLDIASTPGRDTIDIPQATPRTLRNLSSDPRRYINNLNNESNVSNLDRDIDELLEIE